MLNRRYIFAALLVLLAMGAGMLTAKITHSPTIADALRVCVDRLEPGPTRDACLKKAVRTLLSQVSTEELMQYIVASTTPQAIVGRCHEFAHVIGQEALIKSGSLDETLAACTSQCAYGCTHGVIAAEVARTYGAEYPGEEIEHADIEELKKIGRSYCDRTLAMCHAIGHIARIASDSLGDALALCDTVSDGRSAARCYQGVFMEDIGQLSFVSKPVDITFTDYGYPCNTLPAKYHQACFVQLTEYQEQLFEVRGVLRSEQSTIAAQLCASLTRPSRELCFFGLGYKLDHFIMEDGTLENRGALICDAQIKADAIACITGLAENYAGFARYSEAVELCDSRKSRTEIQQCYDHAFRTMGIPESGMKDICTSFESETCVAALTSYSERGVSTAGTQTIE